MRVQTKSCVAKSSMCLLCAIMALLCEIFVRNGNSVFYYFAAAVFAAGAPVFCALDGEKYRHISRTVFVALILISAVTVCYVVYRAAGLDRYFTDFAALASYIRDSGFLGIAIFVALTVFQVVVLPIPEAVTILLGVAIYGATWSFVLSVIGTVIGSLVSFMLGKVFGRKLCNWMFGEENTKKYAEIFGKNGRFIFAIMLLFPAFPDDMLCMIAGITSMSYGYFTIVCLITRPVMIGLTAYLGSGAIPFSGSGIPIWIAIACLLFVAFIVIGDIRKRIDKIGIGKR